LEDGTGFFCAPSQGVCAANGTKCDKRSMLAGVDSPGVCKVSIVDISETAGVGAACGSCRLTNSGKLALNVDYGIKIKAYSSKGNPNGASVEVSCTACHTRVLACRHEVPDPAKSAKLLPTRVGQNHRQNLAEAEQRDYREM
jgi:hypothetical protein